MLDIAAKTSYRYEYNILWLYCVTICLFVAIGMYFPTVLFANVDIELQITSAFDDVKVGAETAKTLRSFNQTLQWLSAFFTVDVLQDPNSLGRFGPGSQNYVANLVITRWNTNSKFFFGDKRLPYVETSNLPMRISDLLPATNTTAAENCYPYSIPKLNYTIP